MWWNRNKWRVIAPLLVIAVLAVAFWFGGDAPGLRGMLPKEDTQLSVTPTDRPSGVAPTEAPSETPAPAETPAAPAETPAAPVETPDAEPAPSETPEATPEPSATPEPTPEPTPAPTPDAYGTEPVPSGKPEPVEPQDTEVGDTAYTCSISIRCDKLLENIEWLDPEKVELVPADGVILATTTATFYEGESVFNVLQRETKRAKIHMEFMNTPIYNSAYIEGINNLYEYDCGERSGWVYKVNDWFPNYGSSRYQLKDGDVIEWLYTCDLGADVGNEYGMQY